ncbi:MAG: hypothetical protein EON98_04365 [Chitinophagaceae bacterium]|nr:MAG: hypothetical protein EON98_04365 [Chitinophagaceae bacterium]
MKVEAVHLYKLLSNIEFEFRLISLHDYHTRLLTLYNLTDFNPAVIELIVDNMQFEPDRIEYESDEVGDEALRGLTSNGTTSDFHNEDDRDNALEYITQRPGKYSKWAIRAGDPDYFPSIPHGHSVKNDKIKLDCYLGYIYNVADNAKKRNVIDREHRTYIIDLWNDDSFRTVAMRAIDWYMDTFPLYNWRVSKPRLLPRKR